jgi:hypothetical protein
MQMIRHGTGLRLLLSAITSLLLTTVADAHHSVLNYDGKVTVKISGIVTAARFGYPHSIYRINVTNDDGETEKWVLSTEDPRDAAALGFADELKAIKRGDSITVVGWPDKFKERTIRGHQLHYPDGRIVMMRRGNYIWPKDLLRLDKFVTNPQNVEQFLKPVDASLPQAEQVILWIDEDDHIARAAYEVSRNQAQLIGLRQDGSVAFPGVDNLLKCHTDRAGFTMTIDTGKLTREQREALDDGDDYISDYNAALTRWWEQERESCE